MLCLRLLKDPLDTFNLLINTNFSNDTNSDFSYRFNCNMYIVLGQVSANNL